jgi:hypothetical protein
MFFCEVKELVIDIGCFKENDVHHRMRYIQFVNNDFVRPSVFPDYRPFATNDVTGGLIQWR